MNYEEIIMAITNIQEARVLFVLCAIFIFADVLTGYLKAFKFKRVNSSISRDGYVKKVGWIIALLLGWSVDFFVGSKMFLIGSAMVCIATEAISVYENLGEIGVNLPFNRYFAKIKDNIDEE